MAPNLRTVADAVHYVVARTDPSKLGAVKLNKVLWFADLEHYRKCGRSLTGLTEYTREKQGPMSKDINRALRMLAKNGAIRERPTKVFSYTRREFVELREPDLSVFNGEQIDILSQVIEVICSHTADEVSVATHDAYWHELAIGESMSIGAGSVIPKSPSRRQLEWARQQPS